MNKYSPNIASSLLKLKSEFHHSKLDLIEKDPEKWISILEGLHFCMSKFDLEAIISKEDFVIHVQNKFPNKYDLILDELEKHLM